MEILRYLIFEAAHFVCASPRYVRQFLIQLVLLDPHGMKTTAVKSMSP